MAECIVCANDRAEVQRDGHRHKISCVVCGEFVVSVRAATLIPRHVEGDHLAKAALSHYVRRLQVGNVWPLLLSDAAMEAIEKKWFPTLGAQRDNIIELVGDRLDTPAKTVSINWPTLAAITGCQDADTARFHLDHLVEEGLIEYDPGVATIGMTYEGWLRYEEIEKGARNSSLGFLAMGFGDAGVVSFVDEHFRAAAEQTGFLLERLDDRPEAGVMDNRMQLGIKRSRFLLADITGGNNGAYWEAGYAYGLGKPVIYSCRRTEWDNRHDRAGKPHFDVNHHTTVIWDEDNGEKAREDLKAIIRNTIPEAKQEDE